MPDMTSKFEKTYKKLKKNFFSVLLLLLLLLANLKQKKGDIQTDSWESLFQGMEKITNLVYRI